MNYFLNGYGEIKGATIAGKYTSGEVESIQVEELNEITVNDQIYIPRYSLDNVRKKEFPSIKLYKSGKIKSLDLEDKSLISVLDKDYSVEKVVFYETGELKRIFPLNGKLSGYWSEDDEYKLAEEYDFKFKFAEFKSKVISIQLYKSGKIKSITLWPNEKIKITHNGQLINIHTGFSLYESGELETCEPVIATCVTTPIGKIEAYDPGSIGIHGENNSLKFNNDGTVKALATSSNIIKIIDEKGKNYIYSPKEVFLYVDSAAKDIIPVRLEFEHDMVKVNGHDEFNINNCKFHIGYFGEKKLRLTGDI
ncbi:MAG: hypothetical protein ACI398_01195 [Clostridium sp.]